MTTSTGPEPFRMNHTPLAIPSAEVWRELDRIQRALEALDSAVAHDAQHIAYANAIQEVRYSRLSLFPPA